MIMSGPEGEGKKKKGREKKDEYLKLMDDTLERLDWLRWEFNGGIMF